jgi:hypothetical protein
MKKAIALLLALALVGGAVFAQELKFTGYLDTGVAVFDDGVNDPTLGLWGDDSGTSTRFNLQAAVTNENVGATVRLRMQNIDTGSPATSTLVEISDHSKVFVNRAYAWATMLDGKVKTVAGKLGDYTYSSFGNDIGNSDTATGFQVQVMPIDGLNVGVFLPADGNTKVVLEDAFKDLKLGASYSMEGVGSFRAGYDMNVAADTNMAWVSASISAIENLGIIVDVQLVDMGNDVSGETYLFEEIDYTMDALNVGIDLEQTLYADDSDMMMTFGPYVSYDMGMFIPAFTFRYDMQGDLSGMYLNPYVKYKVGPKAIIELGGKINSGDFDETSRYYLSYTWSF